MENIILLIILLGTFILAGRIHRTLSTELSDEFISEFQKQKRRMNDENR